MWSLAIPLQMLESIPSPQDSVLGFLWVTHHHLYLKINLFALKLTETIFCRRHNTADFGRQENVLAIADFIFGLDIVLL
jgi:hypothetical protein